MKRDRLYTVSKGNKAQFARDVDGVNQNIFAFGDSMYTPDPIFNIYGQYIPGTQSASQWALTNSPQLDLGEMPAGLKYNPTYNNVRLSKDSVSPWQYKTIPSPEKGIISGLRGLGNAAVGAAGTIGNQLLNKAISGGFSTGVGNGIANVGNAVGDLAATIPGLGTGASLLIKGASGALGGLWNHSFGKKTDEEKLSAMNNNAAAMRSTGNQLAQVNDNAAVLEGAGKLRSTLNYNPYKGGWFKGSWERRNNNAVNNQQRAADVVQTHGLLAGIDRSNKNQADWSQINSAAYGGLFDTLMGSNMDATTYGLLNDYLTTKREQNATKNKMPGIMPTSILKDGGEIHIKKANRGKFTEQANRAGMGVQEYAAHVLANKEDYPTSTIMRANFARNFGGRHAFGGPLDDTLFALGGDIQTHGSDFTTGMSHIDAGRSHEENPNDGVQVGVDNNNTPNLVEEGETIYNDYVYSNRISLDEEAKKKFHISKKREITYADMAKKLEAEISERPNDPISKAGFKEQMEDLAEEQERQKADMQAEEAREAFNALSPEEQVALMQEAQGQQEEDAQAQQEAMMQEQAMQEQAMAEQQGMVPEEQMMQEQGMPMQGGIPSETMMQGAPMAYGGLLGNQYGLGGNLFAYAGSLDGDDTPYIYTNKANASLGTYDKPKPLQRSLPDRGRFRTDSAYAKELERLGYNDMEIDDIILGKNNEKSSMTYTPRTRKHRSMGGYKRVDGSPLFTEEEIKEEERAFKAGEKRALPSNIGARKKPKGVTYIGRDGVTYHSPEVANQSFKNPRGGVVTYDRKANDAWAYIQSITTPEQFKAALNSKKFRESLTSYVMSNKTLNDLKRELPPSYFSSSVQQTSSKDTVSKAASTIRAAQVSKSNTSTTQVPTSPKPSTGTSSTGSRASSVFSPVLAARRALDNTVKQFEEKAAQAAASPDTSAGASAPQVDYGYLNPGYPSYTTQGTYGATAPQYAVPAGGGQAGYYPQGAYTGMQQTQAAMRQSAAEGLLTPQEPEITPEELRQNAILGAMNAHTWSDIQKWLKDNNVGKEGEWDNQNYDSINWEELMARPDFQEALAKSDPALAHAIANSYDFGLYKPGPGKVSIQSINAGNWDTSGMDLDKFWKGWENSEDDMWKEAMDPNNPLINRNMSLQELEKALMGTKAWQKTTDFLNANADNRLAYLQAIADDHNAPEGAIKHLQKFTEVDPKTGKLKWKDGVDNSYKNVFGVVRTTKPGSYWHSATWDERTPKNLNWIKNSNGEWEVIQGSVPNDWKKIRSYSWHGKDKDLNDYTYNYYQTPEEAKKEAEAAKAAGAGNSPAGVVSAEDEPVRFKHTYFGLGDMGPLVGLGMQAAGIGKPNLRGLEAALSAVTNTSPSTVNYKPIGNYLRYDPMDIWAEQNKMNATSRGTARAIQNNNGPIGTQTAGLLAASLNDQQASGDLYRKALEYNNALNNNVANFNRATDQFNAEAFNRASMTNAEIRNRDRQLRAQLGLQTEMEKLNTRANWYKGIYGNIDNFFQGLGAHEKENRTGDMIAWMINNGVISPLNTKRLEDVGYTTKPATNSNGGSIKRKKKRGGLTY